MGKLIYCMNLSTDGFIATVDRSLDWAMVDDELHGWFNEHARSVDASLYGRRLWEVMAAYWPTGEDDPSSTETMRDFARIWNRTPKVVFSSSLDHVDHGARLVHGDAGEILGEIRRDFDGDLEVGGPNLAGQFVRRGLVDEYRLVIHPVVLGSGIPFWPELDAPLRLRQIDAHRFSSGVELRSYVPA
jgi:dihydrofolate reductase